LFCVSVLFVLIVCTFQLIETPYELIETDDQTAVTHRCVLLMLRGTDKEKGFCFAELLGIPVRRGQIRLSFHAANTTYMLCLNGQLVGIPVYKG
jgi:hypothetical protein